jgi:signal transduction histidine kinase
MSKMKKEVLIDSKILIIDDIAENIQVLAGILHKEKVKISFATRAAQGIETAINTQPDLILMDVTMPEMDGFTATKILKENSSTKDIPVIFLTARTDTKDLVTGFNAGGVDYIVKPYNPTELLLRIITHLELKKSKEEILQQKQKLEMANKEKDKFLSIVSHDLRSPFAGILGLTQFMIEDYDSFSSDDMKEYLNNFYTSLKVQYQFMEDLLSWGNFQMGRKKVHPEDFLVSELLKNNQIIVQETLKQKSQTLTIEFENDIYAFADRQMVSSVVHNLITNAMKFSPIGKEIKLYAKNIADNVEIGVIDKGVGLEKVDSAKLFKIDTVFTNPGTNNEKGTGLGLLLCSEMVRNNKGEIFVDSEIGVGSRFYFTLPKSSIH